MIIPLHLDRLNRVLTVGDCVAYASGKRLEIGIVKKLNPIMITITCITAVYPSKEYKLPGACLIVQGPEVTMMLLSLKSR